MISIRLGIRYRCLTSPVSWTDAVKTETGIRRQKGIKRRTFLYFRLKLYPCSSALSKCFSSSPIRQYPPIPLKSVYSRIPCDLFISMCLCAHNSPPSRVTFQPAWMSWVAFITADLQKMLCSNKNEHVWWQTANTDEKIKLSGCYNKFHKFKNLQSEGYQQRTKFHVKNPSNKCIIKYSWQFFLKH